MKLWLLFAVALGISGTVASAAPTPTQSDYGGIGLLQTPTARMAPDGSLSLNLNRTTPYTRLSLSLQPFEWLEGTYRYTSVSTVNYGPEDFSGNQSYKDKSFDIKARLWQESQWLPEVAIGAHDIAGTGFFSAEYLVGNKRFGDIDLSLGIGWGYLGKRDSVTNPFGWLSDNFKVRSQASSNVANAGSFNGNTFFRGPAAIFGGVQWQTGWEPLQLKLEYEGNNYRNELGGSSVKQNSPFNIGATYKVNDWLILHAGWERGNTALVGITLQTDLSSRQPNTRKVSDPPPETLRLDNQRPTRASDWADVAQRLRDNAGYDLARIAKREREIVVYGEQTRYFYDAVGIGRSARVLDNSAGPDIDWITVVDTRNGMPVTETSIKRDTFRKVVQEDASLDQLRRTTEHATPMPRSETTLYEAEDQQKLTTGAAIGYRQNLGGPDNFLLYQFNANFSAEYRFQPDTWINGVLSANLLNNFDKFKYTAPSNLPRVRTHLREYWTESDVTMPLLQLSHTRRFDSDLFGLAYGGYLESMYAGVGGELLYRPTDQNWAIGIDMNWVKQRDFEQDFGFRDYNVVTGHVTGYYRGFKDVLLSTSVGRYLAGDYGVTFDVSREFDNGVRFGAWSTFTNVSRKDFGEGSFDKGIYISVPFDVMTTRSTRSRANLALAPLTRDGGARLMREWRLYDLTETRNISLVNKNFRRITE